MNGCSRGIISRTGILFLVSCMLMMSAKDIPAESSGDLTGAETAAEKTVVGEPLEDQEGITEAAEEQLNHAYSFEINKTYTAGAILLDVISVMIEGTTWIEEDGRENHGYTIDVYYHVRVNEENGKKPVKYDLTDGRLVVEGEEYTLQNIIRSIEDEMSGRNKTAEPGDDWRVFSRSFCLMEKGANGKILLPRLLQNAPMDLHMTLTDTANEEESLIEIQINGEEPGIQKCHP